MKNNTFVLILVMSGSLLITFFCQKEGLTNRFFVQDDVNQYVPAVYAFSDEGLSKAYLDGDLILSYMVAKNSPGHLYLYYAFARYFDPLILTKILPFLLAALSSLLFYMIIKVLKNETAGFYAALIFSFYVWTSKYGFFSGGLPKAFAFPLLLLFIYFFLKKKIILCVLTLVLQILFYPIAAVLSLAVYGISFFKRNKREKKSLIIFCCIGLACFLLSWFIYLQPNEFLGRTVNLSKMITMPEFGPDGRDRLFLDSFFDFLVSEDGSGILVSRTIFFLFPVFVLSFFYLRKKRFKIPEILLNILYSSFIVFSFSYVLLLYLFFPGRYLEFTLPIFIIAVISFSIAEVFDSFFRRLKYKALIHLLFTVFIIIVFKPFLHTNLENFEHEIYSDIVELPQDAFLAGHPYDMDPVLTFTKRRVFIQFEVSTAWYKNYYARIRQRTYDFFKAYYSDSLDEVFNFCDKYGITHLVVNKRHFSPEYLKKQNYYLEPYNDYIKDIVDSNKGDFVLVSSQTEQFRIAEAGDIFIIEAIY